MAANKVRQIYLKKTLYMGGLLLVLNSELIRLFCMHMYAIKNALFPAVTTW